MGRKRKAEQDYHALARERGIEWTGELPPNVRAETQWQCPAGHQIVASYYSLSRRRNACLQCGVFYTSHEDYHDLAQKRGFEWIGESLPRNTRVKTLWRCSQGHEWSARYNSIWSGRGCPTCFGGNRKNENGYHAVGTERGIQWVGESLPQNGKTKTRWRCQEGHEWETTYNVLAQGYGCPICNTDKMRHTARDYHALAQQKGFEWLAKEVPVNHRTKTRWRCSVGHEFEASYTRTRVRAHCPLCWGSSTRSRNEAKLLQLLARRVQKGNTCGLDDESRSLWDQFVSAALAKDWNLAAQLREQLRPLGVLDYPYVKGCPGRDQKSRQQGGPLHRFFYSQALGEDRCRFCGCQRSEAA